MRNNIAEIFKTMHKPMRSLIVNKLGVPYYDSEDVVQDAFVRMLIRGQDKEIKSSPTNYMLKIAANTAVDWQDLSINRRAKVTTHSETVLHAIPDESLEFLDELQIRMETVERIEREIKALKPRYQEVIRLRYFESMTYHEIAQELNISYRMVLRDLVMINVKLRSKLADLMETV